MMETEDGWGEAPLRGSQSDRDSNFAPECEYTSVSLFVNYKLLSVACLCKCVQLTASFKCI